MRPLTDSRRQPRDRGDRCSTAGTNSPRRGRKRSWGTRRRFLDARRSGRRAGVQARACPAPTRRPARALAALPVQLGVASGDPAPTAWCSGRGCAEPLDAGGGMPRERRSPSAGRSRTTSVPPGRAPRHGVGAVPSRRTPCTSRSRARAGPRVLLPLHGRRRDEPGRPHPHRAGSARRSSRCSFAFASCQNLQDGSTPPTADMAERGPRPRGPPRRLHLRVRHRPGGGPRRRADAGTRRRSYRDARPSTGSATRSTRPTRTCRPRTPRSVDRRPGTTTRSTTTTPASTPSTATPTPTFLAPPRAPPTRPTTSTCRCAALRSPQGPDLQLYRRLRYGDLVEFNVLDTRQYRSAAGHGQRSASTRRARSSAPSRRRGCWTG